MRLNPARLSALLLALACLLPAQVRKTRNVILVTSDGLRWQDLFGGMDPLLMNEKSAGMAEPSVRDKFWRATPDERRQVLMPFFWGTLARKGVVLGNLKKNSSVRVTNGFRVSYPGYSEMLTGRAQDEAIRGNEKIRNPTQTVLEFVRQKLGLSRTQVALFGSWDVLSWVEKSRPGTLVINAGYTEPEPSSPRMRQLGQLQFRMLTPWDAARHDYITFEMAREHLRTASPRLMHIAFLETDDWAHNKRYDRVLQSIQYFDRCLQELWEWIEATPGYRGQTTLILTSDHGRGSTLEDWGSHGIRVAGAEQIWIAVMGPDTPPIGEASNAPEVFQRDVAPTILDLFGVDYREYQGVKGKPLPMARSGAVR